MTTHNSTRFSKTTYRLLTAGGWFVGRDVSESLKLPPNFEIHPYAQDVLKEFCFLRVGERKAGIERAQRIVEFNPLVAQYEQELFADYSSLSNSNRLYPLGEIDDGHAYLAIDDQGRVFSLLDRMFFIDNDFDVALDKLLTGIALSVIEEPDDWYD